MSKVSDISFSPRSIASSAEEAPVAPFMENISLYIPHVFKNISGKRIAQVFESLRIGKVSHVNFLEKVGKNGRYNSVYIHFNYWYTNTAAYNFQDRVRDPAKEARIVYDEPWYWVVVENRPRAPKMAQKQLCQGCEYVYALEQDNRELQIRVAKLERLLEY